MLLSKRRLLSVLMVLLALLLVLPGLTAARADEALEEEEALEAVDESLTLEDELSSNDDDRDAALAAAEEAASDGRLTSLLSLDSPDDEDESLEAADLPTHEASVPAQELGFTPFENDIWPLSSGEGFCYATADADTMTIYRYLLASGASQQIGTVSRNRHYQNGSYGSSPYDFCIYVSGDRLYHVDAKGDYQTRTATYTLRYLDMATGTTHDVFTKADVEADGCYAFGVDALNRVYWVDHFRNNLYVFSSTGTQLASTTIPKVTVSYPSYNVYDSVPIINGFVGFDTTNGNVYYTGTYVWKCWGYDYDMQPCAWVISTAAPSRSTRKPSPCCTKRHPISITALPSSWTTAILPT